MSNRFHSPRPQFLTSTPATYSGGHLKFYTSETNTPKNVYSDAALSSSIGADLTLNSAGYYAGEIFLAEDAAYKVVLEDSSSNVIWTADPVSGSGYATNAQFLTYAGNPNGSVAGTSGTGSIQSDALWDRTNKILYVCTTTGSTTEAVWTAVNASAATPAVPQPQGRLTLTSGAPVLASSVSGGASVYYTPYIGELVPIYNGTSTVPTEFAELTLALVSQHALSTIYDVFVFNNAGVLTLVTGPAWSSSTAGSSSRGSGAGTTQISRLNGLWVNTVQITGRNGSTTYTIGANLATYLGTILIDGSAGAVTCHVATGEDRKWGVWNAYNRERIFVCEADSNSSWTYSTNTFRAANNRSANQIVTIRGLAETSINLRVVQTCVLSAAGVGASVGIGANSTSSISGQLGTFVSSGNNAQATISGNFVHSAVLGRHDYTHLESGNGSATATFNGTSSSIFFSAEWMG